MKKTFLTLILLFLALDSAFAKLILNVGIVNKKGRDKETPLVSEYYSREQIFRDEPIIIKMKDELLLKVKAVFIVEKDVYGPSKKVLIEGELINLTKGERKPINQEVYLEEKVTMNFEFADDRLIDVTFHPVF